MDLEGFLFYNMKKCNHCKIEKEFTEFYKNKNEKDGVDKRCKFCSKIYSKKYREKFKEIPLYKNCKICLIYKDKDSFHKRSTSKDGLYDICKNCRKLITKKYNIENKDKIKQSNDKWRMDNPDYRFDSGKYTKERIKKDPLFKLKRNIGSLILINFKQAKTEKAQKTIDILGCSIENFRKHIESQFLEWMNWNNHGGTDKEYNFNNSWDLDHIIPISFAKNEQEIYMLNHYTNFQPLCSKINRNIKCNNVPLICNIELKIDTQNEKINKL